MDGLKIPSLTTIRDSHPDAICELLGKPFAVGGAVEGARSWEWEIFRGDDYLQVSRFEVPGSSVGVAVLCAPTLDPFTIETALRFAGLDPDDRPGPGGDSGGGITWPAWPGVGTVTVNPEHCTVLVGPAGAPPATFSAN